MIERGNYIMNQATHEKFVDFNYWCPKCKYEKDDPADTTKDICNNCLHSPVNYETSQPVNYIAK